MDARKVSAAVGFTLLMGCVLAVVVVIYNGGSSRTSYRTSMDESWKTRMKTLGRQEVMGSISTTSESVLEAKNLADELQKLFSNSKGSSNKRIGGSITVVDEGIVRPLLKTKTAGEDAIIVGPSVSRNKTSFAMNSEKPTSPLPLSLQEPTPVTVVKVSPSNSHDESNVDRRSRGGGVTESEMQTGPEAPSLPSSMPEKDAADNDHYPTPEMPSINSTPQKNHHDQLLRSGSTANQHRSNILLVQSSAPDSAIYSQKRDPITRRHSSTSMSSAIHDNFSYNEHKNQQKDKLLSQPQATYNNYFEGTDWGSAEQGETDYDFGTQEYTLDNSNNPRDPLKTMGNMLQLVTDIYQRGKAGLMDVPGFLRVINETVQRSNNNNLLSQLNQLYSRSGNGNWSTILFPQKSEVVGRNALENSLSAFVFMSFGVFLLNQIHNFMGTGKISNIRQGRKLDVTPDESELNFLFEPPIEAPIFLNTTGSKDEVSVSDVYDVPANLNGHDQLLDEKINRTGENLLNVAEASSNISNYVNNMFRAAINLVNAYTKDSQALDCIWSKYCQDLDKTSAEHGSLYSIAARINSVGLRLIMGQIPSELTVEVVLRSLLGWDGLPCIKMFSKCNAKFISNDLLQMADNNTQNESTPSGLE